MTSQPLGKLVLSDSALRADLDKLNTFPKIAEEYDEFSSGYWSNSSLWNRTGDAEDTLVCDYETSIQQTEYGKKLPYIDELLRSTFDFSHLKMVRTRNLIDAVILPHRDFVELDQDKQQYYRIFLALETNSNSFHSDEEKVFQMQRGEIWWLDAASVHSAVNFSTQSRIHLCLDFHFSGADFANSDIFLNPQNIDTHVEPTLANRTPSSRFNPTVIEGLSFILSPATFRDIAFVLSKVHFEHDVPIQACFDWLIAAAAAKSDAALEAKARSLRRYLIEGRGFRERFSFNNHDEGYPYAKDRFFKSPSIAEPGAILGDMRARSVHKIGDGHNGVGATA